MSTHYEMQVHTRPKYNDKLRVNYYYNIYRVVQMVGDNVIGIMDTFDSPNSALNWERAMQLMDELRIGDDDDNRQ